MMIAQNSALLSAFNNGQPQDTEFCKEFLGQDNLFDFNKGDFNRGMASLAQTPMSQQQPLGSLGPSQQQTPMNGGAGAQNQHSQNSGFPPGGPQFPPTTNNLSNNTGFGGAPQHNNTGFGVAPPAHQQGNMGTQPQNMGGFQQPFSHPHPAPPEQQMQPNMGSNAPAAPQHGAHSQQHPAPPHGGHPHHHHAPPNQQHVGAPNPPLGHPPAPAGPLPPNGGPPAPPNGGPPSGPLPNPLDFLAALSAHNPLLGGALSAHNPLLRGAGPAGTPTPQQLQEALKLAASMPGGLPLPLPGGKGGGGNPLAHLLPNLQNNKLLGVGGCVFETFWRVDQRFSKSVFGISINRRSFSFFRMLYWVCEDLRVADLCQVVCEHTLPRAYVRTGGPSRS